jgi:hypothetical protein
MDWKRPSLLFLKIWGSDAYVKRLTPTKLELGSGKCIFVGYPRETKGYYFYNHQENKMCVAQNGSFLRKSFSQKKLVGAQCDSKRFEKHKKMFQFPLMRRYNKMSWRWSLTNMLNPNHEDQYGHVTDYRAA